MNIIFVIIFHVRSV